LYQRWANAPREHEAHQVAVNPIDLILSIRSVNTREGGSHREQGDNHLDPNEAPPNTVVVVEWLLYF